MLPLCRHLAGVGLICWQNQGRDPSAGQEGWCCSSQSLEEHTSSKWDLQQLLQHRWQIIPCLSGGTNLWEIKPSLCNATHVSCLSPDILHSGRKTNSREWKWSKCVKFNPKCKRRADIEATNWDLRSFHYQQTLGDRIFERGEPWHYLPLVPVVGIIVLSRA